MIDNPPRIRFGLQVSPTPDTLATVGPAAEEAGFDVITVADHVGPGLAPLPVLATIAATTSRIHLGTMVLNNDMRNPVQLAWESWSLQRLSGGRFELGLGAGHSPHEYAETGIAFDAPAERKRRLAEAVEIIAGLFAGETVDFDGEHYRVEGATLLPPDRDDEEDDAAARVAPPPILVGGNGRALLTHAARHADAIGLQGLGRTLEDGHRHTVRWTIDHLERQLALIADAADPDRPPLELGALVQICEVTDGRQAVLDDVLSNVEELDPEDASRTPYLAVGTVEEIARQMIDARDRWGISYFTVRNPDVGPVIDRVRELEGT